MANDPYVPVSTEPDMGSSLVRASIPLIVAGLATLGVTISPALSAWLLANPQIVWFVIAGLGSYFPSLIAAFKFKADAK